MYSVRGRTVATAATSDHMVAELWNPHATQRIKVAQISLVVSVVGAAGAGIYLRRSTAEGATFSGGTVTPAIQQHSIRGVAPPSGCRLNLAAATTQPTFEAGSLGIGWVIASVAAAGIVYPLPSGIEIPPLAGLCIVTNAAISVVASDVVFTWYEDW